LFAWTSRWRPPFRPFGRREPPRGACGAARHLRSSSVLGEGSDSSRCRIPSPSNTAFNRGSLHPPAPARHGDRPGAIYRRPPTSCAHRLRKPDRTSELLALSVARRTRGRGLHPRLCGTCRARLAVAAVGLRRQHRANQNAFHRIASSLAARAGSAAQVVHPRRLAPHPVARREPWSASSKAYGSPRAIPRSRVPPCRRRHGDPHVPRERCVSPTSATDSRHEHPADRSIPGRASDARRLRAMRSSARTHPGPEPAAGEILGDLPNRLPDEPTRWSFAWRRTSSFGHCCNHHVIPRRVAPDEGASSGAEAPSVHVCGPAQSWRSHDRRLLCAGPPARGFFDRGTGLRHDLWRPCAPSADPASLPHPHRLGSPGPARTPSRQRRRLAPLQDAFHRRVLPPPSTSDACASGAWDHEEPATGVAARVLAAFAAATRLPARFRPLSSPAWAGSQRARPVAFRPGPSAARRLLQPTRSASTTADRLIPAPRARAWGQRALSRSARLALRHRLGHGGAGAHPHRHRRGFQGELGSPPGIASRGEAEATPDDGALRRVRVALSRAGNVAEAPLHRFDSHQPRFTGQGSRGAEATPDTPPRARSCERPWESTTPTRSARTPLVVRALRRRLESPTLPGCSGMPKRPALPLPWGSDTWRSHRTSPTPAKGRSSRTLDASLARTHPGSRAALPALPRRRARSAAPEVPSIGEPAALTQTA